MLLKFNTFARAICFYISKIKPRHHFSTMESLSDVDSVKTILLFEPADNGSAGDIKITTYHRSHFLELVRRLTGDDYDFVESWIASIVQRPSVNTGVIIVLYSAQRECMKFMNLVTEGFAKLLSPNAAKLQSIDELKKCNKEYNTALSNKVLIYGEDMDINSRIKDVLSCATQTQTRIRIRGSSSSALLQDVSNYMFTTSHEIKVNDGRIKVIRCPDVEPEN